MKFPDPPSTGTVTSLMSPMQFIAASKTTYSQSNISALELDKQQFKDAFINLLQVGIQRRSYSTHLEDTSLLLSRKCLEQLVDGY